MRRQAVSHLQQPSGPAEVSRLLSVSEARVWSVLMDEMSLTDEDGGRLSLLFTAAPVLRGRSGEKEMVITKNTEASRARRDACSGGHVSGLADFQIY